MNRNSLTLIFFLAFAFALGSLFWIYGSSEEQGKVTISEATASPIQGNRDTVIVELKLKNDGPPQTILNISSPEAGNAIIHGIEAAEALVLPADSSSSLSTDGAHLMLMGIEGDLSDGRLLTIKMELKPAGTVTSKARFSDQKKSGHSTNHTSMHMVSDKEPKPSISIATQPKPDKSGWHINAEVANFEFSKALLDGDHLPGTGHGHIYLNGLKLGRVFEPNIDIGQLPVGIHVIRITLNTNNHQAYMVGGKLVSASATMDVE